MSRLQKVCVARLGAMTACLLALSLGALGPARARAESSEFNLHLEPAFALPMVGLLEADATGVRGAGFYFWGAFDWQLAAPLAFELAVGGGHMESIGPDTVSATGEQVPVPDGTFVHGGLGVRLRIADDSSGYASEGGDPAGSFWISAHVGAMAWHGPQLAIDLGVGYELSALRPVSIGLFARGVLGLFGEDESPDFLLTAGLSFSFEVSVGVIPPRRYGVRDVEVTGMEALDEASLRACLGTRERSTVGIDVGSTSSPACGEAPFDGGRLRLELFAWPWTEWPLFDAGVFERDLLRVERWMRARGYYEGHVTASDVAPARALGAVSSGEEDQCVPDAAGGCEVRVHLEVDEGEPVRVRRISIRLDAPTASSDADQDGDSDALDPDLRAALRAVLRVHRDEIFDEASYERTKYEMVRIMADRAYPDASVRGEVKVNVQRHEVYVVFHVHTGLPAVLGTICVRGYGELPPTPIYAATYLEPGRRFSLSELEEAQRAVYALGVVSSVEIQQRRPPASAPAADVPDEPEGPSEASDGARRTEGVESDLSADSEDASVVGEEAGDGSETQSEDGGEASTPDEAALDEALALDPEGRVGVPDPAPIAGGTGDAVEPEPDSAAPREVPYCVEARPGLPAGYRAVDLDITVQPGRLERHGVGIGLQAGNTTAFGGQSASSSATTAQALSQWDIHLLLALEWRNLFGNMLRLRIEERPRLIFPSPFPGVVGTTGVGPRPGNRIVASVRWPAFLEARTALFATLAHDYGPAPIYNFFRHELDGQIGLERTFLDGRLYVSAAVRGNLFVPDEQQGLRVRSERETTRAFIIENFATLDLRDDPRSPTEGAFFSLGIQNAGWGDLSSWSYLRITAEARGYIPLPLGIVIAGRFAMAGMAIYGHSSDTLDPNNIFELYALGPLTHQLQGGGSVSHRGFSPGLLGDVRRRRTEFRPLPGATPRSETAIISGGTHRWEGSLELRVPITPEIGVVAFADVGNVARGDFYFDDLNFAFGFGLRYRTIIGPLRLDVAFRPDDLQSTDGQPGSRECQSADDYECRPPSAVDLGFVRWNGAIHLTIGEAF